MQTLSLCLIRGHDEDFAALQYGYHLRCYILLSYCQGVDPVIQQESYVVERTESTFLALYS